MKLRLIIPTIAACGASIAWGQSIPFPGPGMVHTIGCSGTVVALLTSATSWTVDACFNPSNNTIVTYGGGAGGSAANSAGTPGAGGASGGVSISTNVGLTASSLIGISIGAAGAG